MKILIVYGTSEGQTQKISRFIEDTLIQDGHQVVIANATEAAPAPNDFDAILIGSSIHLHKFKSTIKSYIQDYLEALNEKITGFFTVSLAIASFNVEEHEEVKQIAHSFLSTVNWQPNHIYHMAGALKFTKYDYLKKMTMRAIAKKERPGEDLDINRDYEYTDWKKVEAQTLDFTESLQKLKLHGQT